MCPWRRSFSRIRSASFFLSDLWGNVIAWAGLFLCDEGHVERECNLIFPFSRSRLTRGETSLDSVPETDEQDMPEGVAPPFYASDEAELEPEAVAPKPPRGEPSRRPKRKNPNRELTFRDHPQDAATSRLRRENSNRSRLPRSHSQGETTCRPRRQNSNRKVTLPDRRQGAVTRRPRRQNSNR